MNYYRKQISRIAELLRQNIMSQVAKLFRKPRTMLKILSFSDDHQPFQKILRTNLTLRLRWKTFSFIVKGGIIMDRAETFIKTINL